MTGIGGDVLPIRRVSHVIHSRPLFAGRPYTSTHSLQDHSGIYVIVSLVNGHYQVVDCGESATVKSRVASHDRATCWSRHAQGVTLMVAVLYTPQLQSAGRVAIEQEIRSQYTFPCALR